MSPDDCGRRRTAGGRGERSIASVEARAAGEPIMAIVSLRRQQITIYDAEGWILRAPVSTGQSGRETPAGLFSVIQKEAEHHSNLYHDADMPHKQRSPGRGSPCMVESYRGILVARLCPAAIRVCGAPVRRDQLGHACDCGARRGCAGLDRSPGLFQPKVKNRSRGPEVEARYRRPGGAPHWNSGFAGQYFTW
jgi:hypothetical protein